MRLIKQCDFFGHQFHFLINKHNTYQTFIGGACSFVTVIALAIVTYFFGKPLWSHRSPTVTTSILLKDEYRQLNLLEGDFFFAFTLNDTFGNNFTDYQNKLFIQVTYFIAEPPTEEYPYYFKYEMIEYSKCSNFETKVNGERVHIYDDFYCLNLTDKPV